VGVTALKEEIITVLPQVLRQAMFSIDVASAVMHVKGFLERILSTGMNILSL
jgi:hypothetical protein